jgi:hypothetical protein
MPKTTIGSVMNREEEIVAIRQRLIDRQYRPISVFSWNHSAIPLKHRGKRPSEADWQNSIGIPVYRDYAENTGLLTGVLFPLDIDIDDPTVVDEIVALTEILFGRTSVRCRPNSPRRLLPYRFKDADPRKLIVNLSCGKLEFLGLGQHFTAFGKHFTGADYQWQGQSIDEIDIDQIPIIDPAKLSAFVAWAESRWPVPEKAKPNGDGRKNGAGADFRNTCLQEDVEAALKALPCDYEREDWARLSRAYMVGGGSYEVFLEWSRQHPDYRTESWVRGQWNSFKHKPPKDKRPITVATLFAEVFERIPGWKKPSERGADYTGPDAAHVDEDTWEDEDEKDDGFVDCYDTRRTEFPPLEFAAEPYILAGQLTLISANPKMGKSFMALQIALAIATGTSAFDGSPACKQGAVLYLALEDNPRRMKSRLNKLMRFRRFEPAKLIARYTAKRAHEGGFDMLKRWIKRTPEARLIVIDVLSLFRRSRSHREEPYAADLEAMTQLRALANDHDVAIIAIMHNRKSQADTDPFESVSGTMGQTAGAETVLVLQRDKRGGVTLYGRGRDFEVEVEAAVKMNNGYWDILGPASEIRHTDEQRAIIELLRENKEPMALKEIAAALGRKIGVLSVQLTRMTQASPPMIRKISRGRYAALGPR